MKKGIIIFLLLSACLIMLSGSAAAQTMPAPHPYIFVVMQNGTSQTYTQSGQFSYNAPSNMVIAPEIDIYPGQTIAYSLTLADGETVGGTATCIYTYGPFGLVFGKYITMSLGSESVNYSKSAIGGSLLNQHEPLAIQYMIRSSDSQNAIAITGYGDSIGGGPGGNFPYLAVYPVQDLKFTGITRIISGASDSSGVQYTINSYTTSDYTNSTGTWQATSINVAWFLNIVSVPFDLLVSVISGIVAIVGIFFIILFFFIDPYNFVAIALLFEEFAAIVALSKRGDILVSFEAFARYNAAFFQFAIMFISGLIKVLSFIIQALAVVLQATVAAADSIFNKVGGFLGSLLLFFK